MKIDRVLMLEAWIERFGNPRQVRGFKITLDHWLLIFTNGRLNWGLVPFKFDNMWHNHPSFKANLASWWNTSIQGRWEGYRFMEKLKSIKGKLRVWNKAVFGDIWAKEKEIVARIHDIDNLELNGPLVNGLVEERFSLKRSLDEVIRKENLRWFQKCKIKWLRKVIVGQVSSVGWLVEEETKII